MTAIGANTWIWVSPMTDGAIAEVAPRVAARIRPDRAPGRGARAVGPRARRGAARGAGPRRIGLLRDAARPRPRGRRRRGRRDNDRIPASLRGGRGDRSARVWSRGRCTPRRPALASGPRTSAGRRSGSGCRRPATGRRARRRAPHQARDRAAQPLRDEPDQHGRAGPRAGGCGRSPRLRPAARHLPHEHRGEAPGSAARAAAGRIAHVHACGTDRGAPGADASSGRHSSPPSPTRATTARCASSRSPRRTRRSRPRRRSGARWRPHRTSSRRTGSRSCARPLEAMRAPISGAGPRAGGGR